MKPLLITLKSLRVSVLLACGVCAIASLATAQNYYPPSPVPPDLGFLPGGPSKGQIESVNPIAGNLNLSFPIAQLPPGPGGFTAGVNLQYSSAFYTSWVDDNGSGGSMVRVGYSLGIGGSTGDVTAMYPPNGGGGWSYGLGYTVWDSVTLYAYAPGTGISTYLRTPDGTDHLLLLTSSTDANGNAVNFHQLYPDQPIYDIGADGTCQNSIGPCSSPTLYHFQGTLIYASADSTFIRLEVATGNSSTSNSTWKAYFPDGIVVSGSIPWYTATTNTTDQILAAESNQIQDKNGNTITVSNFCAEGSLCTTAVADQYNRQISVQYSSNNSYNTSNWTDFVLQQGVNGPLKTTVNWEIYQFTMPTYEAIYAGPNDFRPYQYNDIEYLGVVASIQFPPASKTIPAGTDGPSTVYTFSYPPTSGSLTWGELHGMTRYTLATGTDITPCLQSPPAAGCTQQYQVNYNYYFDNSANHRYMATLVNPLSTKTLLYAENRDGTAAVPLTETTSYSFPVPGPFDPKNPRVGGGVSVTTYPDGSQTYVSSKSLCANSKSGFCSPVVWQIQNRDLTDTEFGWTSNTPPIGAPSGGFYNPYAQYTMQLVGWWQKGVAVTQDVNGNTTNVQENDWFNARLIGPPTGMITGIPGNLARNVTSTYYAPASNPEYWNQRTEPAPAPRYLRALHTTMVCSVNPCDSTNAFATTSYKYDSELTTANLTTESSHDSVSNTDISKTSSYVLPNGLVNGNVVSVTDPKQNVTQTTYDTNNLYPTQVVQAGLRTTNPVYDFNTGLLTSSKDDNSVQTIYTHDSLGRQTVVEEKGNGGLDRTTTTAYDDVGVSVTTTQDQTGLATTTSYDPLGRVRLTSDGAGNRSQRAYRAGTSGVSYELASNPYNSATATDGWTLTTRDLVNGTVTVQTFQGADPPGGLTFAGSPQPPQWGGNTSANSTGQTVTTINEVNTANTCSGPTTNFQDQAGNTTKYCPDAFGRLVGVTDAAGNLTQYSYDLLDDLKQAVQNGQTRSFEYSSLRRLTKACNPETGTADCTVSPLPGTGLESYTYDANGNVSTKADARSVTTTYSGYDGLNRPHSKSYSDGTPTVTYSYDVDWKGALSSVSSTVGTSVYSTGYTHDGFGRIATSTQTAGSAPGYQFVYTYTPADQLATIQYPSGRTVIYTPDSVGRITSVQDKATAKYYANNIAYTPAGGVSSMPMGNGLTEHDTWNDRQQLRGLTVSAGSTSLLGLQFFPCANQATSCSSGNTGNLQGQTIGLPTWTGTQSYTYDALGRLVTASEGAGSWSQSYSYDTAGGTGTSNNRYVSANSGFGLSAFTPTTNTNFDARNRLLVDSATYDPSGNGNQTSIGGSGGYVYTYDAENRMTGAYHGTATTPISSTGYVYDGDGQRVQKITCPAATNPCTASSAGATATTYVYDVFGNLAAEYATGAGTNPSCETCFVTADQTGSTRMVTDIYGSVIGVYDYLPFGEEVGAGIGGRTTAMGYTSSPDGFNPKFTGQIRDPETGLDHMGFRYYSPQEGRFVTVDPENAGADSTNPQTWNAYAYVGNNPLNATDPSGESWFSVLAGVLAGIATLNPGIGLDVAGLFTSFESIMNGQPPEVFGSSGGLGDLTGCGGPLGTCGTLGAEPWSELTGLGGVQDPGRFVSDAQNAQQPWDLKHTGGCFARGLAVGVGGALVVAGAAAGAVALGAPAAVVTGGLLLVGVVGGTMTVVSGINDFKSGNYAGAAYGAGSIVGGLAAGSVVGGAVGDRINPPATRGWSFSRDIANRYKPSLGSVVKWLGTGPDAGAAAGATGLGAGIMAFLRGGC
jgi:RHS repeat-associated protein